MAEHMSRFHCCTKCAGCAQPFLRWGCTIRSRSCSFQRHQLAVRSDGPNVLAFSPNWFAVPSMQTMRFLLFIPWVHCLGLASKGDEWSLVGTVLAVGCLAYRENMKLFIKRHIRIPDEILTIFFTRDVRAVCHRVKDTVTGRKEVWGIWKSVHFHSYIEHRPWFSSLILISCYHFLMDIISATVLCKVRALLHTNDSLRLFLQLLWDKESSDWNTNASLSLLSSIRVCDSCSCSLTLVIISTFLRYPFCMIFLFRHFYSNWSFFLF